MEKKTSSIRAFMERHFRHFNAKTLVEAALAYEDQLNRGNHMMITLAGAMSTAELGISLSEMIRKDKVQAICCTGANLEEDFFNLVAHKEYRRIPNWRALSVAEELELLSKGLNRVTDTCIPEEEAMRKIERPLIDLWQKADKNKQSFFPYQFMYQLLDSEVLKPHFQINPDDSWVVAAWQKGLPIFTPGWEDSTLGNMFVSNVVKKKISSLDTVKSGLHLMAFLLDWYLEHSKDQGIGFLQLGGGIAGDFPICVVPLIRQDLKKEVRLWSYFCQISDSTTSFGSYSGAVPNEKITWGKLGVDTPKFIIESDATIVAPLFFSYVLGL